MNICKITNLWLHHAASGQPASLKERMNSKRVNLHLVWTMLMMMIVHSFIRSFVHSFVRLHSRSCSFNWPSSFVAPSTIIPTNPCGRPFGCCHRCSLRITDQVIYSWSTTISARLASHLINLLFFIVLSFSFLSFPFCSLLTIRFHWTRTQANTQANVNPFLSFSLTHTHTHATRNTTGYIVIIWSVHYVI